MSKIKVRVYLIRKSHILCKLISMLMSAKVTIQIPESTISSLKKEFDVQDTDLSSFITSLLERSIAEHVGESNSKVFSESETKEIEDDLKGLGYI
jgi:hypothetical protein